MESRTLIGYLAGHVRTRPETLAIALGATKITYGELWDRILGAAGVLRAQGVGPGDRVVLAAPRQPEFLFAYFACHLLHAIAVPHEPDLLASRLQYVVTLLDARLALTSQKSPSSTHGSCHSMPLAALAEGAAGNRVAEYIPPDPDDTADILLTSGTTGSAKGVMLTHRNILAAARNINQFIGNTAEDREAIALPLSHSFGLGRVRCQILVGGALILTSGFQFPKQLFEAMSTWGATGLSFVPAAWAMLARLSGERLAQFAPQLKYIEIGSAAMPRSDKERLRRLFPHTRVCMHYGLTEASRSAFIEFHEAQDRLDSIGRPTPNVNIQIVDDEGRELGPRQVGKVRISGEHLMRGYWGADGADTPPRNFLDSGDLGYRDEEGYLYLCGRQDDVINVGGRKVHPAEVEQALLEHEEVADAVCIAVPDSLTGQAVCAFLVPKGDPPASPNTDALADFLRARLEQYKIPATFEWIASIPRNASGKIDRKAVAGLLGRQAPSSPLDAAGARQ